jgi:predicted dithiol-disulfide oxidoreductase (DUF899 family)
MHKHKAVSQDEWNTKRKELLKKEKELTRLRDQLAKERQELPWVEIKKQYTFDGPKGTETLADLFAGKSQLVMYHFMFQPDWNEGCKGCSFQADHYDPTIVHLTQRNVAMVTVSRAPLEKLQAFQKRMGWKFKWLSSFNSDFNYDFNVTFQPSPDDNGQVYYNYAMTTFPVNEGPGMSVFYKDDDGKIFHTYSTFGRGLEDFLVAYRILDIIPKGRDEAGLAYPSAWQRHHDKYGDDAYKDMYLEIFSKKDPVEA